MKFEQIDDVLVPKYVNSELYIKGYKHGKKSTKLTDFRYSFREGFRAAQLEKSSNSGGRSKFKIKSI